MWTPLLILMAAGGFALILAALLVVGRFSYRRLNRVCGSCGWSLKTREVTTSGGLSLFEMYCPMCSMAKAGRKPGPDR